MSNVVKKLFVSILLFIAFLFAAIYLATPFLVRHYAVDPLSEYGLKLAKDSKVTYNLLTSSLYIDDLVLLDKQQQPVASIDSLDISLNLYQFLFKRIQIADVTLSGGHLTIYKQDDELIVAGVNLTELSANQAENEQAPLEESQPLQYQLALNKLQITGFQIQADFDGQQHKFDIDNLTIRDGLVAQEQQSLKVSLDSRLNEAPISLSSDFSMQSDIGEGQIDVAVQELALAQFSQFIPEQSVQLAGDLSLTLSPKISLVQDNIEIAISQLEVSLDQAKISTTPWIYEGQAHSISGQDLQVSIQSATNEVSLSGVFNTQFDQGKVFVGDEQNMLAGWQSIQLSPQVQITPDLQQVDIAKLDIQQISLSEVLGTETSQPLAQIGRLLVENIGFKDNQLNIHDISLSDAESSLHVQSDKSITGLIDLAPLSQSSQEEVPEAAEPAESVQSERTLGFSLGQFALKTPLVVSIKDESVSPAYTQTLELQALSVGALDSQSPEQLTPVAFTLKDDEYLNMAFEGASTVFADQLNAELVGKLKEMNLPKISPYIKDGLGFEMKSGQLDVDVNVQVQADQLAGDTRLLMRGIEMTKADDYEQGTIKEGQAMPLNVALSLLKDGQGNIDLNVPVSGDVSDPSFGISSFLALILKKAAMSQAKDYLLQTFVPYANVVKVVMTGADYLLKLRIEPLIYAAEQDEIDQAQADYMQQLVKLMAEKPELQIKTCAVSSASDLQLQSGAALSQQQTEQLVALGNKRQSFMKAYLVDAGIESSRVLSCKPEIDLEDNALPRVELKTD